MKFNLAYLATPYSRYPGGLEKAYQDACRLMARLVSKSVPAYSPIAHSHGIAIHGLLDPLDYEIWLPFNEAMMKACDALLVATFPGWRESKGVRFEIDWFSRTEKPIYLLNVESLEMSEALGLEYADAI